MRSAARSAPPAGDAAGSLHGGSDARRSVNCFLRHSLALDINSAPRYHCVGDPDIRQQGNGTIIPTESGQAVCRFGSAACLAKVAAPGRGGILG